MRHSLVAVVALFFAGASLAGRLDGGRVGGDGGGGAAAPAATVSYPAVNVQVGGYVSISPTVTGGTPSSYSVTSGALPDGLSLNSSTGAITGSVTVKALLLGGKTRMGRHLFAVTADLATDVIVPVVINVYGVDIPNPQSLVSFRSAQASGNNFIDDIMAGTTWTFNGSSPDSSTTYADSPLGYAYEFTGPQYFKDNGNTLTVGTPWRATVARLYQDIDGVSMMSVGWESFKGWTIQSRALTATSTFQGTGGADVSFDSIVSPATTHWSSRINTLVSGRGMLGFDVNVTTGAGDYGPLTYSKTYTTAPLIGGTGVPHICGNNSATNNCDHRIAQIAYWPRPIEESVTAASISWCWAQGVSLEDCNGSNAPSLSTTIDLTEPSTEKPVTYSGSYTLTGSATNVTGVTWRIGSGSETNCTGTTSWSCAITHTATSSSDAYVTVTITATGTTNKAVAAHRIGFYPPSPHSAWDAASVDGSNNATMADGDAVTTWTNLGTSGKNLTQSTGAAKPTFRPQRAESPFLRFDGGDHLDAATAADWTFLHNGSDVTISVMYAADSYGSTQYLLNTNDAATGACTTTGKGACVRVSATTTLVCSVTNGSAQILGCGGVGAVLVSGRFHLASIVLDDDAGAGADLLASTDGTLRTSNTRSGSYATDGGSALRVGRSLGSTTDYLTGDIVAIRIYASALTSTQQQIISAIDSWRAGSNW